MQTILMMATLVHCYVGSNAGSPDLQGLHVLECDTETGAAKIVQSVKGLQGTTYFQLDRANENLYSVVRDGERSCAVRFAIASDGRIGEMTRLADLPCEAPCHVELSADGRRLSFAAYTSATAGTIPVGGLDADLAAGRTPPVSVIRLPDDAMGPNALRQKKAYAHFTFNTPDAAALGVIDLGCDRIVFFRPDEMGLPPLKTLAFDAGDGPRHAVWSRDGRFLFVLGELGSCVYSFAWTKPLGFRRIGKWSMLPADFDRWEADGKTLSTKAAAIKLTADGKILMASNRGHDSIAFYDVNAASGELKLRNIARLTGKFPRDFELMPGERFMVVGHKMSNEIQIYGFDRENCTLTPVGKPLAVWRPLCFKFGK